MVEELLAVVGREHDDGVVPPTAVAQGREDPPEVVVDLHREPRIDGPHLAHRGVVLVSGEPLEAGREVPRVQAGDDRGREGVLLRLGLRRGAAQRHRDLLGGNRVREGCGSRERRMRRDEGEVGAERRRPRDRQPGQEAVGQEGRLAVRRREDGRLAEAAAPEDAVTARVGIVDPEAPGLEMGQPGRRPLGQQRIDRHAGADVLVVAVVGVEGRLAARVERRVGVAEEGRPVAGAAQFGEQGRVPGVEWDPVAHRSMLVGIEPGHEPRPCRTAGIGLAIVPGEVGRLKRQSVEVRRAGESMALSPEQVAAPLVDRHEQDIGAHVRHGSGVQAGNTWASRGSTLMRTRSPIPISAVSRLGQSALRWSGPSSVSSAR